MKLSHDPTIPLLSTYTDKIIIEKVTYTPRFTEALFTILSTWKPPRCPVADTRIKKLWYIYIYMEYYSAIERNTSESVILRWMKLEPIVQSEASQKEKNKYYIQMHTYKI